jgi:hypothetical protein
MNLYVQMSTCPFMFHLLPKLILDTQIIILEGKKYSLPLLPINAVFSRRQKKKKKRRSRLFHAEAFQSPQSASLRTNTQSRCSIAPWWPEKEGVGGCVPWKELLHFI